MVDSVPMTDHADQLVAQAKRETGLEDLGEDTWGEGLRELVRAADTDGRYTEIGRTNFEAEVVRNLRNRLLIEQLYAEHPEIDEQECEVELLGVGFPRTGSTALAAMLGEDHRVRHLRMWEAGDPIPPPGASPEADAQRIAAGKARIEMQDMMEPRLKSMLPQSATGPLEDHDLLGISFQSQHFIAMSWVPSYADWFLRCDMVPAYRYEKRVLKVLQWKQGPTRWWLKSPTHSLFLAQREQVFPETRYVMTHRDVSKVLPSVADLYTVMLGFMNEGIDPIAVGELNVDQWGTALDRMLAYREGSGRDGSRRAVLRHRVQRVPGRPDRADPRPLRLARHRAHARGGGGDGRVARRTLATACATSTAPRTSDSTTRRSARASVRIANGSVRFSSQSSCTLSLGIERSIIPFALSPS